VKTTAFVVVFLVNLESMERNRNEYNFQCYCCGYFTIEERGNYYICRVCFWEDDGRDDLLRHSGPNHMNLERGRKNFLEFGACEERFVKNVVKNPEAKFRKENL
jgi:hypothetical protein